MGILEWFECRVVVLMRYLGHKHNMVAKLDLAVIVMTVRLRNAIDGDERQVRQGDD